MDNIIIKVSNANPIKATITNANPISVKLTGDVNYTQGGDMYRTNYDTNFNGVIDTCEYIDCGTF